MGDNKTEKDDTRAEKNVKLSLKQKKIIIIFTSVFLGIVLLFGMTLGIISAINNAGALLKYKGKTMKSGVVNYLASSYKYDYIVELSRLGISAYDTERFWAKTDEKSGKTYGEILTEGTEEYIKSVLVGAYLFDKNTSLTSDDKEAIAADAELILTARANGSIDEFNSMSERSGFDYSDFKKALEFIYKAKKAKTVIFGYKGQALSTGNYISECDEFLSTYSHVKLLYIRTESRYTFDADTGERIIEDYTDEKRAEIAEKAEEIRQEIYNFENNTDDGSGQMNPDRFTDIIRAYGNLTDNHADSGYYFSSTSEYTAQFIKEGGAEIVNKALSLDIGHYCEVVITDEDLEDGDDSAVWFIYRYQYESGDYMDTDIDHFFGDFYSDAADFLYLSELNRYIADVTVADEFAALDFVKLPKTEF